MDHPHPSAEIDVDASLVRALIASQCPGLAGEPVAFADEGWDNVTFRLGADHAVRLPRRERAVELLVNEQRWLPMVADWIAVDVPLPVVAGEPSELFRWPWSVVRWVEGSTAEGGPLDERAAESLAEVLTALHRPPSPDAPGNPFRGIPLEQRSTAVEPRLRRLGLAGLDRLWRRALEAGEASSTVWLHGDLHPRNVVVRDGRLAGLIDWGDMCAGDRATDLACAWTLFEASAREVFLHAYPHSDDDYARACGWAVNYGSGLVESGEPRHVSMGEDIIRRLLDGG